MKKIILGFCLMLVLGTTIVPKLCEEHHQLDYCWLEKIEVKDTSDENK